MLAEWGGSAFVGALMGKIAMGVDGGRGRVGLGLAARLAEGTTAGDNVGNGGDKGGGGR